jgi:hypothetical protein
MALKIYNSDTVILLDSCHPQKTSTLDQRFIALFDYSLAHQRKIFPTKWSRLHHTK